jgi:3-dehydroquinate dehydratase/shikimate dehydrogenase
VGSPLPAAETATPQTFFELSRSHIVTVLQAQLVATLTTRVSEDGDEIRALSGTAAWLEVRGDLVGDLDASWLRDRFEGRLLYTLRSSEEGGVFRGSPEQRRERLQAAAGTYDYVDLEVQRDLEPELLAAIPAPQRVLSWHGPPTLEPELRQRFQAMSETPAALYKMIPEARQPGQALEPILLLHHLKRNDLVAFATGTEGSWTRLVAPRLGAPVVYGSAGEVPGAPGQWSIQRLVQDFGLPHLPPVERLYGIVGNPVGHSLSPRLHNDAYRRLGLPALYLPFEPESFGDFWIEVMESEILPAVGLPVRGLSVTAPFKRVALAVAGASSPLAERIGAANTLVWNEGVWEAEMTDPDGVLDPLEAHCKTLAGVPAAVLGCGGAGRAAAVALVQAGARVTLVNRGIERGEETAEDLHLPFVPLGDWDPASAKVVVHATSLGRRDDDPLPFDPELLEPDAVVVDLVYRPTPTPLVQACRRRGLEAVDGREVLLYQAVGQLRLMTGHDLPLTPARRILGLQDTDATLDLKSRRPQL